mmetsp:Transcript_22741/g.37639  ORF Transcript_22741/g.37639 Transcript_22741/m.37639 type:complete len:205 (-) Transcript_22741:1158-1772(-)
MCTSALMAIMQRSSSMSELNQRQKRNHRRLSPLNSRHAQLRNPSGLDPEPKLDNSAAENSNVGSGAGPPMSPERKFVVLGGKPLSALALSRCLLRSKTSAKETQSVLAPIHVRWRRTTSNASASSAMHAHPAYEYPNLTTEAISARGAVSSSSHAPIAMLTLSKSRRGKNRKRLPIHRTVTSKTPAPLSTSAAINTTCDQLTPS